MAPSLTSHHSIFHTICGSHTCHLVRAKLFCGPHHFLFSHFPSFTPITLLNKLEPSFNHTNKNSNNNNNQMRPIRWLIPPPPQSVMTTTSQYRIDMMMVFVHGPQSSSINRYRIDARSSSTVSVGTPRRNPNRRVQGIGILKSIHVGILKPQIQIQTHPYLVMECSFRPKNSVMKNQKKKPKNPNPVKKKKKEKIGRTEGLT